MTIQFEVLQSKVNAQWFWHAVNEGNNAIVGAGAEGFTTRQHATRAKDKFIQETGRVAFPKEDFVIFRREELANAIEKIVAGTFSPDELWGAEV